MCRISGSSVFCRCYCWTNRPSGFLLLAETRLMCGWNAVMLSACGRFVKTFKTQSKWDGLFFFLNGNERGGFPPGNMPLCSYVIVSGWSCSMCSLTAQCRVSLVWVSVPLLQLNLPCHYYSRAACLPACLPHCPWMADVRLPALSPLKDDWNVGDRQKQSVMIQVGEMCVFERVCMYFVRHIKAGFTWGHIHIHTYTYKANITANWCWLKLLKTVHSIKMIILSVVFATSYFESLSCRVCCMLWSHNAQSRSYGHLFW